MGTFANPSYCRWQPIVRWEHTWNKKNSVNRVGLPWKPGKRFSGFQNRSCEGRSQSVRIILPHTFVVRHRLRATSEVATVANLADEREKNTPFRKNLGQRSTDAEVPELDRAVVGTGHDDEIVELEAGDAVGVVAQRQQPLAGVRVQLPHLQVAGRWTVKRNKHFESTRILTAYKPIVYFHWS